MIFDASSIWLAVSKEKFEILKDKFSAELVKYEIGNVLWKKVVLEKIYSLEEVLFLADFLQKILNKMNLLIPEIKEVLEMAVKLKINFYDASYLALAKKLKMPLITEDRLLKEKSKRIVKVYSLREII